MNGSEWREIALLPFILLGLLGGLCSLWLWCSLKSLGRKLDQLHDHCRHCRREVQAALAGRLEHDLEPSGREEAPPHSGPGPQGRSCRRVRVASPG